MHVVIAKVDQNLYDGEAYSLNAPGSAGEMTVLSRHEPLVTTLRKGELRLRETPGGEAKIFPIEGGVMEVRRDGATVIL